MRPIILRVLLQSAMLYLCSGCQRWAGVDFDEPGLEVLIDDDVIAVELKAVFVIDHHILPGGP